MRLGLEVHAERYGDSVYSAAFSVLRNLADDGKGRVHLVHNGQDGYFSLRANDDGSVGFSFSTDDYPDDRRWPIG